MSHVSPSQIHTFRACKRKWWYSRNRRRTSNRYAEFGSKVHAIREDWLNDGKPPDTSTKEGACALAGLEHLPAPGSALVEIRINLSVGGVDYLGFADVLEYQSRVWVHDHKTCGTFDYALTEEDLLDDPQRIIYSAWALEAFRPTHVGATWHYLRRNPPECRPVSIVEDAQTVRERFHRLHVVDGQAIAAAQAANSPDPFPRSLNHCSAYGGCPFKEECLQGVSPFEIAAARMKEAA